MTKLLSAPNALPPSRRVTLRPASPAAGSRIAAVAQWPGRRPLLADIVPLFERLGVRVADAVALPDEAGAPLSRLELLLPPEASSETALPALEQALAAAWAGETDLDGLSRLTVTAGLTVADVAVLRAACRYLAQAGLGLSRSYVEETVLAVPDFVQALLDE